MRWISYGKDIIFNVPIEYSKVLINGLLSTGNGNRTIYILGLHGYIFPEGDINKGGRISIKGKQGEETSVEFNYKFAEDGLVVSQFQSWGLNINFAVRIFKEFVRDNI